MRREFHWTREPWREEQGRWTGEDRGDYGAVVRFEGVVRAVEAGRRIRGLEYTAYEAMARHQFEKLFDGAGQRWPALGAVVVVHRLGFVPSGETSLWVLVAAPHRSEALVACGWLIDEMKRWVPIWKQPVWEDPLPPEPVGGESC